MLGIELIGIITILFSLGGYIHAYLQYNPLDIYSYASYIPDWAFVTSILSCFFIICEVALRFDFIIKFLFTKI